MRAYSTAVSLALALGTTAVPTLVHRANQESDFLCKSYGALGKIVDESFIEPRGAVYKSYNEFSEYCKSQGGPSHAYGVIEFPGCKCGIYSDGPSGETSPRGSDNCPTAPGSGLNSDMGRDAYLNNGKLGDVIRKFSSGDASDSGVDDGKLEDAIRKLFSSGNPNTGNSGVDDGKLKDVIRKFFSGDASGNHKTSNDGKLEDAIRKLFSGDGNSGIDDGKLDDVVRKLLSGNDASGTGKPGNDSNPGKPVSNGNTGKPDNTSSGNSNSDSTLVDGGLNSKPDSGNGPNNNSNSGLCKPGHVLTETGACVDNSVQVGDTGVDTIAQTSRVGDVGNTDENCEPGFVGICLGASESQSSKKPSTQKQQGGCPTGFISGEAGVCVAI